MSCNDMNQNTISKSIFLFFCSRLEFELCEANDTPVVYKLTKQTVGGMYRYYFITILTVSKRVKAIHSLMNSMK